VAKETQPPSWSGIDDKLSALEDLLDDLAAPKWTKSKPAQEEVPAEPPPVEVAPAPAKPAKLKIRVRQAAKLAKPTPEPAAPPPNPLADIVPPPEPTPAKFDELMRLLNMPVIVPDVSEPTSAEPAPDAEIAPAAKPARPKMKPVKPKVKPVVRPVKASARPVKDIEPEPEPDSFKAWLGAEPDEELVTTPTPRETQQQEFDDFWGPDELAEPVTPAKPDTFDEPNTWEEPHSWDEPSIWDEPDSLHGPDSLDEPASLDEPVEPAKPAVTTPIVPRSRRATLVRFGRLLARTLFPGPMDTGYQPQWRVASITGAAVFVLLIIRLLVPTPVGMSDQGDGQRLLCQLGVANVAPSNYVLMWQHIYTQWIPHQWYGETCGTLATGNAYISSQLLLLWPAKFLTPLFGWGFGLDTRAVGIVCAFFFSVLLTLFVAFLPGRIGFRVMMGALVAAVMADGIFVDFFISPYSEAACFLGVFAMFVAMLYMWRKGHPTLLGIGFFTLATLFTITAKTQMVAVLPVAIGALLWRCTHRGPSFGQWIRINWPWGETPKSPNRLQRAMPAFIAIGLLTGCTVGYYLVQPRDLGELNRYNAIFSEMLPNSDNPKGDLQWFGLDPAMSAASGTTVASTNSAIFDPGYKDFNTKVTQVKIMLFYVVHPNRLVSMLDRGLDAMAHPVLGYLGSYTADSGQPASAKEHRWPVVQEVSVVFAAVPALFIFVELLTPVLGIAVASRRRLGRQSRAFGMATALFSASLILQFWAVMLSEGASEIYKHMIVVTFMNALCLVWIVGLALVLWAPANLDEGVEGDDEAAR